MMQIFCLLQVLITHFILLILSLNFLISAHLKGLIHFIKGKFYLFSRHYTDWGVALNPQNHGDPEETVFQWNPIQLK